MRERHVVSTMVIIACGLMSFSAQRAIAITDREAQAQTVTDIRNVGTAMFSWLVDQVSFASPGPSQAPKAVTIHFPDYPVISHGDLESILVPVYIQAVPELDGWGHPYDFRLNTANPLAQNIMAIRSPGRDGEFSGDTYLAGSFDADDFDQDIVWADGALIRWPEDGPGMWFHTLPPCRVVDTRLTSALQSGISGSFQLGGACGIPMSAKAVAANVTVIEPTGAGHVTLFPGGLSVPSTSTINFAAGQVRANNAILGLGGGTGLIGASASVTASGQVHLILDVSGYFE